VSENEIQSVDVSSTLYAERNEKDDHKLSDYDFLGK
jgi:hypothetical protein